MKLVFSHLGLTAAPGFAHNRLTRPQRGRFGASLVLFPTWLLKAHTGPHRDFSLLRSSYSTFPLRGKAGLNSHPSYSVRPDSSTTVPHGSNGACLRFRRCRFPYPALKTARRPSQGLFLFCALSALFSPTGKSWSTLASILLSPPRFVHNRVRQAQQSLSGVLLVSFPYPAPKIAHRATQGRV